MEVSSLRINNPHQFILGSRAIMLLLIFVLRNNTACGRGSNNIRMLLTVMAILPLPRIRLFSLFILDFEVDNAC